MVEIQMKLDPRITDGLDKFEVRISNEVLLSGVAAMARLVYDELKLNTSPPRMGRVTGTLHDAVYRAYSPERSVGGFQIYHASVNKKKAPHWHFLEYGTSKQGARPYIRPAFDRVGDAINAGKRRITELLSTGDMV